MENKKVDITALSNKELHELEIEIKLRREAEKAEKKRLSDIKRNYTLVFPDVGQISATLSHRSLCRFIARHFRDSDNNDVLTRETMLEYVAKNVEISDMTDPGRELNLGDVYQCPHCGEYGTLRVAREYLGARRGMDKYGKYYIECCACSWEAPRKAYGEYTNLAWQGFHEWLVSKSFLPEGTEFVWNTIKKEFSNRLKENPQIYFDRYL